MINGAPQVVSTQPARGAAMWFLELYEGYRSAQFLQVSHAPTDAARMLHAETAELRAWRAASDNSAPGPDGSLPPRPLGIWVAVNSCLAPSPAGERLLDAMAHWAHTQCASRMGPVLLAQLLRISVVTGTCARLFFERAATEGAGAVMDGPPFVQVGVRWVNPQGQMQTHAQTQT